LTFAKVLLLIFSIEEAEVEAEPQVFDFSLRQIRNITDLEAPTDSAGASLRSRP
jgi:hypothetical protein